MLKTPMHNRFAEGFLEPHSWGDTLDALSSRVRPTPFVDLDAEALHRQARLARNEALAAATAQAWRELRAVLRVIVSPLQPIVARLRAWRARERAAAELYALDERTLAELGLRRGDIPFVADGGEVLRERPPTEERVGPQAANSNDGDRHAA